MTEILLTIVIAMFIAALLYLGIEFREIFTANRDAPKVPPSSLEADRGKIAIALDDFTKSTNSKFTGRVRLSGEEWSAVFVGESVNLPVAGDKVTIVEIDASNLKAIVR